jgi:hypothetical protein
MVCGVVFFSIGMSVKEKANSGSREDAAWLAAVVRIERRYDGW